VFAWFLDLMNESKFIGYIEMRTEQDNSSRKEATFKASKKTKKNMQKLKSNCSCNDDSDEDK
jgi:hypothetical protein